MNLRNDNVGSPNGLQCCRSVGFHHATRADLAARLCLGFLFSPLSPAVARETVIILPDNPSADETLAAREVRRYVYLRTGGLLPILTGPKEVSRTNDLILVAKKGRALITQFAAELRAAHANPLTLFRRKVTR